MESSKQGLFHRVWAGTGQLAATIVAAIVIGGGVPLLWIWIGSLFQDEAGSGSVNDVNSSTAVVIFAGIVITYLVLLIILGKLQAMFSRVEEERAPRHAPAPWNRSLSDEPYIPGRGRLSMVERIFVTTATVASIAMLIWFFGFAGSPLPD